MRTVDECAPDTWRRALNPPPRQVVRHRATRADDAAAAIRTWIIEGRLEPGDRLVEGTLADLLGTSRVPVREALQRLAEQGFVDNRAGQSARVAQRSARDIIEMFEVRSAIEMLACGLAAVRRGPDDVARLRACVASGIEAVAKRSWDEVGRRNAEFHLELARISGNAHLLETIDGYRYRLAWLHGASARQRGAGAWHQHAQVVDAIDAGDAEAAERHGRDHVRSSIDTFTEAFLDGEMHL